MKKNYQFGEIMLILREEYNNCKYLLEELKKYVFIEGNYKKGYFNGTLKDNFDKNNPKNPQIWLYVEKRYSEILKRINCLKYSWYSKYLYTAIYNVIKNPIGYCLKYDNQLTVIDEKKYIPHVEIIDEQMFSQIINQLFNTELMQLERGDFEINFEKINLDFSQVNITSTLGLKSIISWNGVDDTINYDVCKDFSSYLLEWILSLEIPASELSSSWIKLLEKYENHFAKQLYFSVDSSVQMKKGKLKIIDTIDKSYVKLLKK